MNTTKVLIAGAVLAIAAYFVVGGMNGGSAVDKVKAEWFSKIDANKDGKISPEEAKAIDTDNDGKISREEAKAYGIPLSVFDQLDVNKDGFISSFYLD
jgi:Ca2+-binding EF-hand superfamily protein